jgi:hypothetical protein
MQLRGEQSKAKVGAVIPTFLEQAVRITQRIHIVRYFV